MSCYLTDDAVCGEPRLVVVVHNVYIGTSLRQSWSWREISAVVRVMQYPLPAVTWGHYRIMGCLTKNKRHEKLVDGHLKAFT